MFHYAVDNKNDYLHNVFRYAMDRKNAYLHNVLLPCRQEHDYTMFCYGASMKIIIYKMFCYTAGRKMINYTMFNYAVDRKNDYLDNV